MKYLPLLVLAASLAFGCSITTRSALTGHNMPKGARAPSADVRLDKDGLHTDARHGFENYRPPIIREQVGGMNVNIDPRSGDVTGAGQLGGFLVQADSGGRAGVRLRQDVSREEFSRACVDAGVSMKIDDNGVHVAPPSATVYSNGIRAGLRDGHFDVIWDGVAFDKALEELNSIVSVRIDARAGDRGFEIGAVPAVRMTLLDISSEQAVGRLASHADLKVEAEASNRFVLTSD